MIVTMHKTRASVDDESTEYSWEYSETLSTPQDGNTILKPNGSIGLGVCFVISSGSGKVQTTTDTMDAIYNGTAVWIDWSIGITSNTVTDYCKGITAIRQVNVSGTTKLLLRAD